MDNQHILIYGKENTGKSLFVKRLNGIEKNEIEIENLSSFPVIYVLREKPTDADILKFDIIIEFTKNGAIFEKGFLI